MLTHVEVEDFQSLRKLSVQMGRFTVVTGATGSGKSALLRALHLAAFNARGNGYIRRGAKSCKVGMGDREQGWFAAIERGGRGKDAYRIARLVNHPMRPDGFLDEPEVDVFTKLEGKVPEPVSALLRLSDVNFASDQFGRPFLLDSSGGEIARVLGKLTNVTLLFDAAREANRRKLEIAGDLRRAEAHLAGLTEQAQRFAGLKERQAAVSEAESALERAHGISARAGRLRVLTGKLEAAEVALERAVPPEVPPAERLEELAGRLARLRELAGAYDSAMAGAAGAQFTAEQAHLALRDAEEKLHEVLAEAGQCPVCGQAVA